MYYWVLIIIFVIVVSWSIILVYEYTFCFHVWEQPLLLHCSLSTIPVHFLFEYSDFFRSIIDILVDLEKYWIRFDDTFSINIILIILYILFASALCVNFCGIITYSFTISFIFSWWDVRGPCKCIHACFFIWSVVAIMKWVQTIVGMFSLFSFLKKCYQRSYL